MFVGKAEREAAGNPDVRTADEVGASLAAARRATLRHGAAITGLRVSESPALKWEDVRLIRAKSLSRVIVYQRLGQMKQRHRNSFLWTLRHGKAALDVYVQAITPWVSSRLHHIRISREAGRE